MADPCLAHPYELAEGLCRSCGGAYCADCIVYPFGADKPPLCISCAIAAGGVRRTAKKPSRAAPKEKKERLKEWRKAKQRDLSAPAPDGVATWQAMDAADADSDDASDHVAEQQREALRLPPPEPEAPPQPIEGINFAPPAPAGTDWRDEVEGVDTNFGPPGTSFDPVPIETPAAGAEAETWAPPPIAPNPYESDPLSTFEPPAYVEPVPDWDSVPTFEPEALDIPLPVTVDMSADPLAASFGAPPEPLIGFGAPALDDPEPLIGFGAPALDDPAPLAGFGLPEVDAPPLPLPPDLPYVEPALPAPAPAVVPPPMPAAIPAPAPMPAMVDDVLPPPPPMVRPPTPTRIPAASTEPAASNDEPVASNDAKDLLARIAELRRNSE